jgi:type II secretory pathway pseudopilin PulG
MEYGRGGGLDRSNILDEDRRKITSGWYKMDNPEFPATNEPGTTNFAFFFEKPYWQNSNFAFADGQSYSSGSNALEQVLPQFSWSDDILWVPVSIQLADSETACDPYPPGGPTKVGMSFRFDATVWQPAVTFNAGLNQWECEFDLPTERLLSASGYSAVLYDSVAGVSSPIGDTIVVEYTGSFLNMVPFYRNPFIILAFRAFRFPNTSPIYPIGITRLSLNITEGSAPLTTTGFWLEREAPQSNPYPQSFADVYVWDEIGARYNITIRQTEDKNAQQVEWVYKTQTIGDGKTGIKPRGVVFEMTSRGHADDIVGATDWPFGLMNTLVSTNYKDYQTQYIDLDSNPNPNTPTLNEGNTTAAQQLNADINSNIGTIWNNGMQEKTFDNAAVYGDPQGTTGNLLIDNAIYTNIVTSDGTRGDRFSYTFFGNVRNKAEKLYFKSANAAYRVIGALRRWGR